jgi:hypothetical protein
VKKNTFSHGGELDMSTEPKAVRSRPPFELRPTNIKGVHSFVPPKNSFDHRTVSDATLLKHGVLVRRPDPNVNPGLFQIWRKALEEIWTEQNFVLPALEPQFGVTHQVRGLHQSDMGYRSFNWAGCVLRGSWDGAMGVWQVPTISKPSTPQANSGGWNSSSWVGLDGSGLPGTNTQDVLQAGIAQTLDASGNPSYVAWYEWFVPNPDVVSAQYPYVWQTNINTIPVKPGDTISVVVQYVKNKGDNIGNPLPPPGPYNFGGVLLVNVTTNQAVNLYLDPPTGASFAGDSAEWIMELNDGGTGTLPRFTSINFNQAGACNAQDAPSPLNKADLYTLVDRFGYTETNEVANPGSVTINYNL